MKIIRVYFFFFCLSFTCFLFSSYQSFERLMGHGTPSWKYMQTSEDYARLDFFKSLYEKKREFLFRSSIPKTMHFIWLGPEPFPEASKRNIKAWIEKHPAWTFNFWTDADADLPCQGMKKKTVEKAVFSELEDKYYQSENFGERSEILRYEILFREGGLYVDHDTFPIKTFDSLQESYDFYCGLEMLGSSVLSSSVFPSTHLIASKPNHPILRSSIEWLAKQWDNLETYYPGTDASATFNRIRHRSFSALSEGIKQSIDQKGNQDIVFPSLYFSSSEKKTGIFSLHAHLQTWNKKESEFEKKINKNLDLVQQSNNKTQLILLAVLGLNVMAVFVVFRKRRSLFFFVTLLLPCLCYPEEFDVLMGKNTQHWKHIQKEEDLKTIKSCRVLYEARQNLLVSSFSCPFKIPKIIHFIWLGARPFPPESVENVRMWIAKHPDWTVQFWTDRDRPSPCEKMQRCFVQDFSFLKLKECYLQSQNWGEKSDILRYEILFQEGGVYVDHDANCLKSFEGLHRAYDFYCGLETPHPTFAGLNVTCGNGVIGSKAKHPVIAKIMDLILERWNPLGERFRGNDSFSKSQLVLERTYSALTHAIKDNLNQNGNIDIVLPAAYFFAKQGIPSLYSKHFYGNSWADDSVSKINEKNKETLHVFSKIKQKNQNINKLSFAVVLLNIFLLIVLLKPDWVTRIFINRFRD